MPVTKARVGLRLKETRCPPQPEPCERARQVASTAHSAADALLHAYEVMRGQRGRPRGMTTDNEQDLLRSMLVMAAAGLDATVKQLVEDAVPSLVRIDAISQNTFEKFVQRRILGDPGTTGAGMNVKALAAVLAASNPQKRLLEEYVSHLTGGSLQSFQSLLTVAAALGIEPASAGIREDQLGPIFRTRNKIIHELDINLTAKNRTRTVRSQASMIKDAEHLFLLAFRLIELVGNKLRKGG